MAWSIGRCHLHQRRFSSIGAIRSHFELYRKSTWSATSLWFRGKTSEIDCQRWSTRVHGLTKAKKESFSFVRCISLWFHWNKDWKFPWDVASIRTNFFVIFRSMSCKSSFDIFLTRIMKKFSKENLFISVEFLHQLNSSISLKW